MRNAVNHSLAWVFRMLQSLIWCILVLANTAVLPAIFAFEANDDPNDMDYEITPIPLPPKPKFQKIDPAPASAEYGNLAIFTGLAYPGPNELLIQLSDISVLKGSAPDYLFVAMRQSFAIHESPTATITRTAPHLRSGLIFGTLVPYGRYMVVARDSSLIAAPGSVLTAGDIIAIIPVSLELNCHGAEIRKRQAAMPDVSFWTNHGGALDRMSLEGKVDELKDIFSSRETALSEILILLREPSRITMDPMNADSVVLQYALTAPNLLRRIEERGKVFISHPTVVIHWRKDDIPTMEIVERRIVALAEFPENGVLR